MLTQTQIFFLFSTVFAFLGMTLFPIPLLAYAPYLAHMLMTKPLKSALWHSLSCGLFMDALQSSFSFGFCSLEFCLVTLILYQQKHWFFNDKLFSLSLFSSLFCLGCSLLQLGILSLKKRPILFSWSLIGTDCLLVPLYHGIYAFICFTIPYLIYLQIKKYDFNFIFIKKLD
jgi:hypothetical protein